LQNLDR